MFIKSTSASWSACSASTLTTAGIWPPAKTCCDCVIRIFLSTTISHRSRPNPAIRSRERFRQRPRASTTGIDAVAGDAVGRELIRLGVTADRLTPDERMQIIASLENGGIFPAEGARSRMWPTLHCTRRPVCVPLFSQIKRTTAIPLRNNKIKTQTAKPERNSSDFAVLLLLRFSLIAGGCSHVSKLHAPVVLADSGCCGQFDRHCDDACRRMSDSSRGACCSRACRCEPA